MTIEYICRAVADIRKKYDSCDPFELAKAMGITVMYEPMGTSDKACKGFFLYQSRRRIIVINRDLSDTVKRIVLAHELGHSVLHTSEARLRAFNDFSLYDETSQFEYDANLFAAEFLLDDDTVLRALNDDDFFFGTAKQLNVPAELLDFKFRILKRKGFKLNSPIMAKSSFLKDIRA